MSNAVALVRLRNETRRFALAPYLLTVSDDAHPHAVAVAVAWAGDALTMTVGRQSASNAQTRPQVSLLWPPSEPGGYSLIVDGVARSAGGEGQIAVTPTRAVLHRPAATPGATKPGCSADCVPILR